MNHDNFYLNNFNNLPSFKQTFNKDVSRYITNSINEGNSIEVPLLLCPSYPHDGTRFTYTETLMTGDISPTLPIFIRELDKLIACSLKSGLLAWPDEY